MSIFLVYDHTGSWGKPAFCKTLTNAFYSELVRHKTSCLLIMLHTLCVYGWFLNRCSWKFRNIHNKTPMLESLFNKVHFESPLWQCHFFLLMLQQALPSGHLSKAGRNFYTFPSADDYLTQFSPLLRFKQKPLICFSEQNIKKTKMTLEQIPNNSLKIKFIVHDPT